jgi:hypothetical protein
MGCCGKCIGDRHLTKEVIPRRTTGVGTCTYCGTQGQPLVEPELLRDEFELLMSIYSPHPEGRPLLYWLRQDWAMLDEATIATPRANQLLGDILEEPEILQNAFVPSQLCQTDNLERWHEFRKELMYSNRFFPKAALDLDRLSALLPHLLVQMDEVSTEWYRARLQRSQLPHPPEQMGAPPKEQAPHGRANPAGIPYLYLASIAKTAIAETRPHTGECATVAKFAVAGDLKIVDLRDPRRSVSPFILGDESEVAFLRGDVGYLDQLGEELTRPVLPHAAAIDYLPSQYLCEFVKNCGYHGVIYRSSVGDGTNLALFDPARAAISDCGQQRVTRVSVDIEEVPLV